MKIKILKVRLHPKDDPDGYIVGFKVTTNNGRDFNVDSKIPFNDPEVREEAQIIKNAWMQIREETLARVATLEGMGSPKPTFSSTLTGKQIDVEGDVVIPPPPEPEIPEAEPEIPEDPEPGDGDE